MKTRRFLLVCLALALCISSTASAIGSNDLSITNEVIRRAMAAISLAIPRAQSDPARPIYHITAPANWMNDPNGPIYHKGYYHLFYQLHPFSDESGQKFWGHVRSRDLVKWEHLPVALWPSQELGEDHVYSGCATINGKGQPMIFYTSISRGKSDMEYAEQWAATGDDDLIHWRKHPANPVLSEKLHGGLKVYDWRDPFVFHHQNRTFMVLGGNLNKRQGGQGIVSIYEAGDEELTKWKYLGELFRHPDPQITNIECPNFFQLGKQWVLLVSPFQKVQYFVGNFDPDAHRFNPQQQGILDYGGDFGGGFYAPNCLLAPRGRRIVWGWITGFKAGRGWNGCLTLPRVISLDSTGQLLQEPAPELKKLRRDHYTLSNVRLNDSNPLMPLLKGDTLEIMTELEPGDAKVLGLKIRRSDDGQRAVSIRYDGRQLEVAGKTAPFQLAKGEKRLQLRVFLDRSILEVYVNRRICFSRSLEVAEKDLGIEFFAEKGQATLRSVDIWRLSSIWQ